MSPELSIDSPLYCIDYESLQRHPQAIEVALFLRQKIDDPQWSLRRTCRGCETWVRKDSTRVKSGETDTDGPGRIENYPHRPGAAAPHESCNGCWFSLLDEVDSKPRPTYTPLTVAQPNRWQPTRLLLDIKFSTSGVKIGHCE